MPTKSKKRTTKKLPKAPAAQSRSNILLLAAVGIGVVIVGAILGMILTRTPATGTSAAVVPPTPTRLAQAPAVPTSPPLVPPTTSTPGGLTVSSTPPPGWTAIKPEELKQKIESKADILIIDVRTKEQYAQGHIKGAISVPVADLEQQYKDVVPHDKEVVLYCEGGT
jgi:hypothetical protein